MYRTDSEVGETGTTGFIPTVKKLHLACTDDYFISHGAAVGSTISMVDNGYIKLEYW